MFKDSFSKNKNSNSYVQQREDDFRKMESWRLFRIMAEFVEGFEMMAQVSPAISIFGSARTKQDNVYYQWAEETAERIAQHGFNVITGGGLGIMEAANKGASKVEGRASIGLNIDLPFEQVPNEYINHLINFRYFFVRKVMFSKYAAGIIVLPGGYGTFDELFENLTLIQTKKIHQMPVVLMGKKFWKGLIDWMKDEVYEQEKNICPGDLDLIQITDDPKEAVDFVVHHPSVQNQTLQ